MIGPWQGTPGGLRVGILHSKTPYVIAHLLNRPGDGFQILRY